MEQQLVQLKTVKGHAYPKEIYSQQEEQLLLDTILKLKKPHFMRDYVFFKLLFATGRRNTETRMTRIRDLQLDISPARWTIPAEHNKCRRTRIVILPDNVRELLQEYIKEYAAQFRTDVQGETYIFYSVRDRSNQKQVPYFYPYLRFHDYLKAAGLYRVAYIDARGHNMSARRIHDTRRSFCNKVFKTGKKFGWSMAEMARVTDHKDINVLNDFYLELSETRLQEEYQKAQKETDAT